MRNIVDRPEIVMVGAGDTRVLYGTAANIRAALAAGHQADAFHAITSPELAGDDTVRVGIRLLKPGPDSYVTINPTVKLEPSLWRLVPWRHVGSAVVMLVIWFAIIAGAVVAFSEAFQAFKASL